MPAGRRILIAGVGPLPDAHAERLYAPGLRFWSYAQALWNAGHQILVAEAFFDDAAKETGVKPAASADETQTPPPTAIVQTRKEIRRQHAQIPLQPDLAAQALLTLTQQFRPEAVVVLTDVLALAAVRSRLPQPLYVDYNGDPMAERQMQGAVHDSDAALYDAWAYMLPVLLRADRFSACSGAQRFALMGQLAAAGRLNRHTCSTNLIDVIPPGLSFERSLDPTGMTKIRGTVVPPEATIILFTGGYNTWLDERGLFTALEEVMTKDLTVHYVSTGGGLPGHNTLTFERFQKFANASRFSNRYHFLGWVPGNQIADIVEQADIAINLDRKTPEAELGFRNRLLLWMRLGTPVASTAVSEALVQFAHQGLMRELPCGDAHGVAEVLLDIVRNRDVRMAMAARAKKFVETEWTFERLTQPLIAWAESPTLAPDRLASFGDYRAAHPTHLASGAPEEFPSPDIIKVINPLAAAQETFLEMRTAFAQERSARQQAESRLAQLEGSRFVKIFKAFKGGAK